MYGIGKPDGAANLPLSVANKAPGGEAGSQREGMGLRSMTEVALDRTDPRDIRSMAEPAWDRTDLRDMRSMAELALDRTEPRDIRTMAELALDRTDPEDIGLNSAYDKENYTGKEILQTMSMNMMDRCAHEWLRFDASMHQHRVHIFVDSGASNCYLSKRIVDQLGLEMKRTEERSVVHLEGGKTIPTLGFVQAMWQKNGFSDCTKFIVLDMRNDVILGQDFWIKYQLVPDYVSLRVRVHINKTEYHLHRLDICPHLQLLENIPQEANLVDKGKFQRLLRKGAEPYLYIVRNQPPELEPLKQTTGDAELDSILGPLLSVFSNDLPNGPPPERPQDHTIETGDAHPMNRSPYSLSKEQLDEQKRQIEYLINRGLVRPSTSPWGAPVLFAKKKDGSWRMCIDYRGLNSVTVRNGYPLPKIQDCLDMIGTATHFSKIDLTSGYWQINVKEKDCLKTAFNTHSDKYEFCVMLFELTNASATFQEIMNDILHLYLDKFVVVYLDNILIYSNFREEHLEHVQKVLALLKKHKLYAKLFKCAFLQQAIEFCDHIVGQGSV